MATRCAHHEPRTLGVRLVTVFVRGKRPPGEGSRGAGNMKVGKADGSRLTVEFALTPFVLTGGSAGLRSPMVAVWADRTSE